MTCPTEVRSRRSISLPLSLRRNSLNEVDIDFLQFSADGRYLVAANGEPRIRVWEMELAAQEGRTVQTRLERENLDGRPATGRAG